jgi:amino acid permease
MTAYQEQRLNILNYQIEQLPPYKSNIKKLLAIIGIVVLVAIGLAVLIYYTDLYTGRYQDIISAIITVLGIITVIVLYHFIWHFQTLYKLRPLLDEKETILNIIKKQKRNFKRFEKFDEIGKEENKN